MDVMKSITTIYSIRFIKIDKSMLDEVYSEHGRIILEYTVRMMQSIGKILVVEGAETDEVVRILEDMHCDYIQGFHFSRPLPEEAFIHFIGEQNGRRTDNCGANSPRIYCSPN